MSPSRQSPPPRKSVSHARKQKLDPGYIRRPTNAFLLFRCDFLKKGIIPNTVEQKQQNLSRIVGECWHRLTPKQKGMWRELAQLEVERHQKQHPNYVYRPEKRDKIQRRSGRVSKEEAIAHCNDVRVKFVPGMDGPVLYPQDTEKRRRKSRAKPRITDATAPARSSPVGAEHDAIPSFAPPSPVFADPLLPPEAANQNSWDTTPDPELDPIFFNPPHIDLDAMDDSAATSCKDLLDAAAHIREVYDTAPRATTSTITADAENARLIYNSEPFFVPQTVAQSVPEPQFNEIPFTPEERASLASGRFGYCDAFMFAPRPLPQAHDLPLSPSLNAPPAPHPFPMNLEAQHLTSLPLQPPEFAAQTQPQDTLMLSFDTAFLGGLELDGLFGQPGALAEGWQCSDMMQDLLSLDVCDTASGASW